MSNLPPSGEIPRGAIRFNTDSNKPELWDGFQWVEFQLSTPNLGRGQDSSLGGRAVVISGWTGASNTTDCSYWNMASIGNAQDFGALSPARRYQAGCSDATRGLTWGGYSSTYESEIVKTTIASTGSHETFGQMRNAADDGNEGRIGGACWASSTRAIHMAGTGPSGQLDARILYATIQADGNSNDFGDLINSYNYRYGSATGNKTRAIALGGRQEPDPGAKVNTIQFVTIATTGNAFEFGDASVPFDSSSGTSSNGTRAVIATNGVPSFTAKSLDQIRPASGGNSYNFGELSTGRQDGHANSCMSTPTRGFFAGGLAPGGNSGYTLIDYVTFETEGTAVDFGDLTGTGRVGTSNFSNSHGGL